jgi:hypothetical protein
MSKYKYEIRKGHECEDIADAVEEMLGFVPEERYDHVREWVADAILLNSRNDLKLKVTMDYLNDLKIDGWTGDIAKIFEPYLDIAITKVIERGADRLGVNEPGNEDLNRAKAVVRRFQRETNLSYNHMLLYFMNGATVFMLNYLLNDALERLAQEKPKVFVALIEHFIPEAVSLRLKGESDGQESNQDCSMAG